jgi:hypothetical protein
MLLISSVKYAGMMNTGKIIPAVPELRPSKAKIFCQI